MRSVFHLWGGQHRRDTGETRWVTQPRERTGGRDLAVPSRYQGVLQDGQTSLPTHDTSLLGAWVEMLQEIQFWGKFQLFREARSLSNQS